MSEQLSTVSEARGTRVAPRKALLLLCSLLLIGLPFATAPGDILADTKFELVVNPSGFLSSALTLWDPQQFGGLLNQAVGYLFPMGPFFELFRLLSVDGWVIQRLWLGLLLVTAFGGTVRLATWMGIGTPWTRPAAGLAYALSPVGLTLLGQTSAEFLPMAMLPWILVPLTDMRPWATAVRAGPAGLTQQRPGRRMRARAVARSAVAVALCSGMNAASATAVLLPAVIYILTRPGTGPAVRTRMLAWWVPAVVLVTANWSVPLVLLFKYGVSIVPFTESAQVTASSTSLLNIFRGTEDWVGYLVVNGQEWRPLAFQIATDLVPALLIGVLAAVGLAGLTRRDLPERRFLLWSALLGVVIISLGYVSSLGDPLEQHLIALINGPGSAFRNLWKFDPMLRLPLALGLAHLLAVVTVPRIRVAVLAVAALGFGGLAVPAVATGLASAGSFGQVPGYWVQTADWLTAHAGHQAVLIEPGAPFGQYVWGSPMDDVLQALTNVDYAERNLSVVGSAGNERLLDAIDQQLAAGDGSAALTQVLARMGIKYVVVRNDLSRNVVNGAWPARVSEALATSGGITEAAGFGPVVSGLGSQDAATDFDPPYPAVQIYQVLGAEPVATVQPAAGTLRVYGGPESLITLASEGLLGNRPVFVNDDNAGSPVAGSVLTDSLRRRTRNFGQLRTNYSPTLTATDPALTFLSADDFTEPAWTRYQAVARYTGIKDVTASSSDSDISALSTQWQTGTLPYSAVDGNLGTMWESGGWNGPVGQWIRIDFDAPVDPHTITVTFADNYAIGPPVTRVTVSTATGAISDPVRATGDSQQLRAPSGASGWLRITITGLAYQPVSEIGTQVGISDIEIPGVTAGRTIVAPVVPGGDPTAVVLAKAQSRTSGCMLTTQHWVCSPGLASSTEEQFGFDHSFYEPSTVTTAARGSAVLVDPSLADHYAVLDRHAATVTASSTYTDDVQDQARSAFDGNPATTWVASPSDDHPRLTIGWDKPVKVGGVTFMRPPGASASVQVLITGSAGQVRGAVVGPSGAVTFAPMRTRSLTFTFTPIQAPLQITDVVIPGVPSVGTPTVPFRLPCGLGPALAINGTTVPTKVSGTFADLLSGRPMTFTACSPVSLTAGADQVTESRFDAFDIQDVVLGGAVRVPDVPAAPADILTWSSSVRKLRVSSPVRSYLVVNENFNAGWRAVIGGRRLAAVRLDGWKQAWVLPAGTAGVVTLTYQPAALYHYAIIGGLGVLALAILLAVGLWWPAGPRSRRRQTSQFPVEHLWLPSPRWSRWSRWRRSLGLVVAVVCLAGVGLILGGYPGAIMVPVAAIVFTVPAGERVATIRPWLLGGLLVAASACGAVGEHLALSGDIGLEVSAPANTIPQVICLIVVAGLAGALLSPALERNRDQRQNWNSLQSCV